MSGSRIMQGDKDCMKKENFSQPMQLKNVEITDDFWLREQELVRREVIPYQWEALNDRVEGAAPSYCMHNFKAAGKMVKEKGRKGSAFQAPSYTFRGFEVLPEDKENPDPDKFYGFVFQDSDFFKWIEAVGYSLISHPDKELEKIADEAIDIVCAAQWENGYLDTYYIINGMDRVFTNLRDHHELYCFGHLAEGAVSYYQATGKDKLLKAAEKYADYIASYFGEEEGKCKGYPGHEIAEMALVRLFQVTGNEKYLSLSRFFLNMRGTQPYYFDVEEKERMEYEGKPYRENTDVFRYTYHQANQPVRQQKEAAGHAVRAVYLYSGMADVARLTGDEAMYQACEKLWNNITEEKLYVTGGIGGTHLGEAFSYSYDLPNDTAYSETCAAIGLAFFARRMLEIQAHRKYADVMELALYNTVLAGMALDGKSFFYVNPLEAVPEACRKDGRKAHVKPVRQKWFGCACCPPNIARIVTSLGAYAFTETEDTLYVHLYAGSKVTKKVTQNVAGGVDEAVQEMDVLIESGFPWNGKVRMEIHTAETEGSAGVPCTIALRIPGWCKESEVQIKRNGETVQEMAGKMRNGYLYLTENWQDGDSIEAEFPMKVRMLSANRKVREDIGKVALARGPLVYCAEEADNGESLQLLRIDPAKLYQNPEAILAETQNIAGQSMTVLKVPGSREVEELSPLYREYQPIQEEDTEITLVPYYAWNNRGEGEMSVWLRCR